MRIDEMFGNDYEEGYRTEKDDQTVLKLGDLRKSKLTLEMLNKLRIMSDIKAIEKEQKRVAVQQQYKSSSDPTPEF